MFLPDLKLADVTPIYKKKSKNCKDNYRQVSILSNISKIMKDAFMIGFRIYHCGFCRSYKAQPYLITLLEKRKKSVDNGGAFGALFIS